MNWFKDWKPEEGQTEQAHNMCCSKLEGDPSIAFRMSAECDSFGSESTAFCEPCWKRAKEEEGSIKVQCQDCTRWLPKREVIEWRWWGFYAPQGDEPLQICRGCSVLQKHRDREERDRAERNPHLYDWGDGD